MMQAAIYTRYGPSDVLHLIELERPVPQDHEVLIKVHAVAVSAADCAFRRGEPFIARLFSGLIRPKNPTLGFDLAGEVVDVGRAVSLFRRGDQVVGSSGAGAGCYVEYKCLPEDGALSAKPAHLSYVQAVAVCEGGLTALPFLRDAATLQAGQGVLINGASGSVGSAAVQIAKASGAQVTGVCSAANLELVRALGADQVIDYTTDDFTRSGRTYDVIFDAVGKRSFASCRTSLSEHGIYLSTVPTLTLMAQMLWTSKGRSKKAAFLATGLRTPREKAVNLGVLNALAEAGTLKPVIDRCYPLDRIAEAHAYVEQGHKKGTVVVTMHA